MRSSLIKTLGVAGRFLAGFLLSRITQARGDRIDRAQQRRLPLQAVGFGLVFVAVLFQFTHFQQFEMTAENGRQLGHIAVYIQHTAVIVPEDTDTGITHG